MSLSEFHGKIIAVGSRDVLVAFLGTMKTTKVFHDDVVIREVHPDATEAERTAAFEQAKYAFQHKSPGSQTGPGASSV